MIACSESTSSTCNLCEESTFLPVLNLGLVPISHRYQKENNLALEDKHELAIKICQCCSLIQINSAIPAEKLYKDYNFCVSSWKPQPHMHDEIILIETIMHKKATIVEIGSNDGSFLKLLKNKGYHSLIGIEPNQFVAELAEQKGIQTIPLFFNEESVNRILRITESVDLFVARQCVEHISNLKQLMFLVNKIVKINSWIMFEVPDFEIPMINGDCSALWEEHVNYFTEPVMSNLLESFGYEVKIVKRYSFSGGALTVFAKRIKLHEDKAKLSVTNPQVQELASSYQKKVQDNKIKILSLLQANRKKGVKNILYGTGCRANALINGLELAPYFDLIVDDQNDKHGFRMPGTTLYIHSSAQLYQNIGVCFLSVNAENEHAIMKRHLSYSQAGGEFYSLNSPSNLYLPQIISSI